MSHFLNIAHLIHKWPFLAIIQLCIISSGCHNIVQVYLFIVVYFLQKVECKTLTDSKTNRKTPIQHNIDGTLHCTKDMLYQGVYKQFNSYVSTVILEVTL